MRRNANCSALGSHVIVLAQTALHHLVESQTPLKEGIQQKIIGRYLKALATRIISDLYFHFDCAVSQKIFKRSKSI